jgi:hypothetical protein
VYFVLTIVILYAREGLGGTLPLGRLKTYITFDTKVKGKKDAALLLLGG